MKLESLLHRENRTASTPAPLKGSLISFACTQTIDRIVKEEARGINFTPDAIGRSDSPYKEDETPAACSHASSGTTKRPI
jgi:hypothetical protein